MENNTKPTYPDRCSDGKFTSAGLMGNKYSIGNRGGFANRKYATPEEMAIRIDEYFEHCENAGHRPLVTGLALFLGFSDRVQLHDYKGRPEFTHVVKCALMRVEAAYEEALMSRTPVGAILALKNMGWQDSQHTHHTGLENITLSFGTLSPQPEQLDQYAEDAEIQNE